MIKTFRKGILFYAVKNGVREHSIFNISGQSAASGW